jgi:hypothetical protein
MYKPFQEALQIEEDTQKDKHLTLAFGKKQCVIEIRHAAEIETDS